MAISKSAEEGHIGVALNALRTIRDLSNPHRNPDGVDDGLDAAQLIACEALEAINREEL